MSSPSCFLSSTFADFKTERAQLQQALRMIQVLPICAEDAGDAGVPLSKLLIKLIDQADMVVVLVGSRAGDVSPDGRTWTRKESEYAVLSGKKVFAYIRETSEEERSQFDSDRSSQESLTDLVKFLEGRIAIVPRYTRGDCCRLTAMVIRDVSRYAEQLQSEDYDDGFLG